MSGIEEEGGLFDPSGAQTGDKPSRSLLVIKPSAATARDIVERHRDAFLGRRRGGSKGGSYGGAGGQPQDCNQHQKPPHPVHPGAHPSHPIVGITKAFEPSPPPSGQRWVTVLTLVQNFSPSVPYWLVSPKALRFQPPKL